MLLVRPWVSIHARLAAYIVASNPMVRKSRGWSLGRPGGTTAPCQGRAYGHVQCFDWRRRPHLRLIAGLIVVLSVRAFAAAQTPKDAAAQNHSPRNKRLAALGLLAVPLEDDK